ncbi:unnamed protein product [Zymoseptoria tritici ST99CH_1A5]|uniref:BTB domain-containing protein n=3 Tax=Zymoseptoria tritici TaxID=1047171 RepID=A0A1X7S5T2_ZYMT9|nr:unnamed protein product [Zymoseptoria tritici ST99CH_3D7]SMR59307.1 unnamed protein product [Zymoseptoria tritici ST99CH_1E4]SMR63143.1 unnamed protein product [Zymoseptoria tritici ST99CH_3D1]SMY28525.1 unnamed protein product [Zymoseptoria tritici ST99CH_1A5]
MSDTLDISAMFNDPTYADLIIHFGPHNAPGTIHCHTNIVCTQSSFFRAGSMPRRAIGPTTDPVARRIYPTIFTIHPYYDGRAVQCVLQSLYHPRSTTKKWLQTCLWSQLFRVYELARLFGVKHLVEATSLAIKQVLEEMREAEDEELHHAQAIIAATPRLREVFEGALRELEIDEVMRSLGSFTIE